MSVVRFRPWAPNHSVFLSHRSHRIQLVHSRLSLEAMQETGGELTVTSGRGENGELLVSVSDTGVGLPPDKGSAIFEAFFTTKPQGTGMGLSISRTIIESHGGKLWAASSAGRGATSIQSPSPGRDAESLRPSPALIQSGSRSDMVVDSRDGKVAVSGAQVVGAVGATTAADESLWKQQAVPISSGTVLYRSNSND